MNSYVDIESQPIISHLIKEVTNFKKFMEGFLCNGRDALEGHTNAK